MKRIILWMLMVVMCLSLVAVFTLTGCKEEIAPTEEAREEEAPEVEEEVVAEEKESYHFILINNMATLSHFYPDYCGAQLACDELKAWTGDEVTFEVVGPSENDIMAEVEAMESAIAKKPDGFMVICWDPAMLQAPIDKAMDAGIPVVSIDADSPDSKRLCYIGTDWYVLGTTLGEALMAEIDGEGKVAMLGLVGADNMETAFDGFREVASEYPDVEIVALEHDDGQPEESARIAAALIQAHPDIAGFAGFDAGSAPGIVTAVREAGKGGKIKIVGNDVNTPQLQAVEEGIEHFILGQKREFFGYWGVQMLYTHVKSQLQFTEDDETGGIVNIPPRIVTGFHYVTQDNYQLFVEAFANYAAMEMKW